jgi:hypothetical protein
MRNLDRLLGPHDPLVGHDGGLDPLYLVRRLVLLQRLPQAERYANGVADPLQRLLAQMELAAARQEPRKATELAQRALALDPASPWARYRLDALALTRSADTDASLDATVVVIEQGRRLREARDWEALARLEPELAALDVRHPARSEALQLRVDWRLGRGSSDAASEALALIDGEPVGGIEQLPRRALAGALSHSPGVAGQSLDALGKRIGRARLSPLAAEWLHAAIDATPKDELSPATEQLRQRVYRKLEARADAPRP